MLIENFIAKLKEAKTGFKSSGSLGVKCKTNTERTEQTIYVDEHCHHCNRKKATTIRISFFTEQHLTVFQAEMIFYLYSLNKKVCDYADYHKCVAGERFIKNIKEILVDE